MEYLAENRLRHTGFLFCFGRAASRGMWDLNSPTRDQTRVPHSGSTESYPLDHQGSPRHSRFNSLNTYLLCIYSIPGTVLGTGDIAVSKTDNIPVLMG